MKLNINELNQLIKAASNGKYIHIDSVNIGGVDYDLWNYPVTFELS